MLSSYIRFTILFVILVLLQVLILDHISFLGYATPFIYIYLILKLPIGINRYLIILIGFLLGFIIDLFCNTPGMNAAATTCIAFFRRPIQGLFFERDDFESYTPSLSVLGAGFMKYVILSVLIHHTILFLVESFSYFNIIVVLLKILSSSIITSLLIFAIEIFSSNKKKV